MTVGSAVREYLRTLTAVTTRATAIRRRRLIQSDNWMKNDFILLFVNDENFDTQNISGKSDLVTANITISCISSDVDRAWELAEAVRTNNENPGSGLQGAVVREDDYSFDAMLESRSERDIPNQDGSDSGLVTVDSEYTIKYYETV